LPVPSDFFPPLFPLSQHVDAFSHDLYPNRPVSPRPPSPPSPSLSDNLSYTEHYYALRNASGAKRRFSQTRSPKKKKKQTDRKKKKIKKKRKTKNIVNKGLPCFLDSPLPTPLGTKPLLCFFLFQPPTIQHFFSTRGSAPPSTPFSPLVPTPPPWGSP